MQHLDVDLAHRLIKGRLDVDERRRWEAHVDTCSTCEELLADERSFVGLLSLRQDPPSPAGAVERVLKRIEALSPQLAARRRRRVWLAIAGYAVAASVILASAWSFRSAPRQAEREARELGISPAVQAEVVAQLDLLEALRRDRWLAEDYVTVRTLSTLLEGKRAKP